MQIVFSRATGAAFHRNGVSRRLMALSAAFCLTLAPLLAAGGPAFAHGYQLGELELVHPWSRATPDGARVAAGYVVLKNGGAAADRLLSADAEIAERAEIHEMAVDGQGVMTMRALPDGLEIPAGGEAALKPGSFHIMFLGLKRGVKEGERFKGTLTFQNAGTIEVEYAVEAMGGGSDHDHHDHDHDQDEGNGDGGAH